MFACQESNQLADRAVEVSLNTDVAFDFDFALGSSLPVCLLDLVEKDEFCFSSLL